MDGLTFYWVSWMGWIIATFFLAKNHPNRRHWTVYLLLSIIFSSVTFNLKVAELSGTGIFLLLLSYIYLSQLRKWQCLYFILSSFIIMLTTVSFLMFELFDPALLFLERKWLLSIIILFISILLYSDETKRIYCMLFGMLHGDFLYSLILKTHSFPYPVASLSFLDVMAISVSLIVSWNTLERVASRLERNVTSLEKERQKLL